jgi:hypothetical protein
MHDIARIKNFDGEYFPPAMFLDGSVIFDGEPILMKNKSYKSLGQCDITGFCVIQDVEDGTILVVASFDLDFPPMSELINHA